MNKSSRDFRLGVTFSLINMFSLAILGIFDKIGASQTGIPPLIFSTQSVFVGLICTSIFAFIYRKGAFIQDLKKTSRNTWLYIALVGLFAGGIAITLRFLGLTESTGTFANLSQIIITSMTAILAMFFLHEKLSGKFWMLFITMIVATYFVSVGKLTLTSLHQGDIFILSGTIFVAFANIFSKLVVNHTSPIVLSFGRPLFGVLFLLLASLILHSDTSLLFNYTIWAVFSGFFWAVTTTSFFFAIQRLGVTFVTSILMLAPVITMVLEFLILKQTFTPIQIIAAFVVITSGILMVTKKN